MDEALKEAKKQARFAPTPHEKLERRRAASINQLISTALAEKMSALMTAEYLQERAARGDRGKFERAMGEVRDTEPDEGDV